MSTLATALPGTAVAIRWQWSRMPDLAVTDLYAVMVVRQTVFNVEQHCAFLDADGLDLYAWHLLGWDDRASRAVLAGYLRVIDPGRKFAEPSIGRVATVPPYRGIGLGRALMHEGIARTERAYPARGIRINAQQRLEAFYASLAFRTVSLPYQEDGIAHIDMLRDG